MSGTTDDRNDPRLTRGVDTEPRDQAEVYLVLSDEERAKGYQRPLRTSYVHVGPPGPRFPLADLTREQQERYPGAAYVKYEAYPEGSHGLGRYWTEEQLDAVGNGCGATTSMGFAIAETYARSPGFYGATYCCRCRMHRPVGKDGEFVWVDERTGQATDERVGT